MTSRVLQLASLLLVPFALAGCKQDTKKAAAPAPQKVLFVKPVEDKVTEYEEFTGRMAALEMVELRSRVSGYLEEINDGGKPAFKEGDDVYEGQLLFQIDERPFVAEEARTKAAIAQYEARLDRLTRQEDRSHDLFKKQAISQDEYETIKFDRAEADASLKASKAQHDIATLNLKFTKIRAPISGRIGRRLVDPGNLVTADQTALATIVPLDKVYVYFDMDERTLLKLRRMQQAGEMKSPMKGVTVGLALADSEEFNLSGELDFQDNQVDPATGTIRMRAIVDNSKGLLSPGLFVRVRYPIRENTDELLVPEESLGSDQGRPFVYIIGDENKVVFTPVELGPQVGNQRVIREGVAKGDRIVVTGLQRIRRNAVVDPQERTAAKAEVVEAESHAATKTAQAPKPAKNDGKAAE